MKKAQPTTSGITMLARGLPARPGVAPVSLTAERGRFRGLGGVACAVPAPRPG